MSTWGIGKNDPSHEVLELREKLASRESTIAAFETKLMRKNEEHDELKSLYDELVNKLRVESERALSLERDLRQTKEDLSREKISTQNLQSTIASTQQAMRSTDMNTRELEATLESISHESNSRLERCNSLEKEKAKLEERVREMQTLLQQSPPPPSSRQKQGNRPRSSSLSNLRITTLESDLNEALATLQQREKELEVATKKLATVQAEANRLGNEKAALEKRTARQLEELEAALAEKEEELHYLRESHPGGDREQELLERIEEDEAKIAALEQMVRGAKAAGELERKLRQTEAKLQDEVRRAQSVVQQHLQVREENDVLLLELNTAREHIRELEQAMQSRRRKSVGRAEDENMDEPSSPVTDEANMTLPLPDEGTVEYIERLLAAIDRLRDERDGLRRDVQFLESESKFAIEALEAKLSRSMAASTRQDDTTRTMNLMKREMDAMHEQMEDMQQACNLELEMKDREIRRLGQALTALGVVVGQTTMDRGPAMDEDIDPDVLEDLNKRLDDAEALLEAMTGERNDLAATLRRKETSWKEELQEIHYDHQEANCTIKHLESEMDHLTKAMEQLESERNSLALHITNLEEDLKQAQDELAKAESRYTELQFSQLSSMSASQVMLNLRNQIKELEGRVLRRNEQLGIHQHDIRRLETNLRLQEERLAEMTTELEMVSDEKAAMVEDCADAREARDAAIKRMEEAEEIMETLESNLEESEATIVTLIGVIIDTAAKARQALRETPMAVDEELQNTLDEVDDLKEENSRLERTANQLAAQLENQLENNESLKLNYEARAMALQNEIDAVRFAKDSMEESHAEALRNLEEELELAREQLRDAQEIMMRRTKEVDSIQQTKDQGLEQLQTRVNTLQSALSNAESQFNIQLKQKDVEIKALVEERERLREEVVALQDQLSLGEAEHKQVSDALNAELGVTKNNLKTAQESLGELERERQRMLDELEGLQNTLKATQEELEAERDNASSLTQNQVHQLEALKTQIQELSVSLHNEQEMRQSVEQEHQSILSTSREQHQAAVAQLERDLEGLREKIKAAERARDEADGDRNMAQEQLTDTIAKLEQTKSLQRQLEAQIAEKDLSISRIQAQMDELQDKLNSVEQANAAAKTNLGLLTAQHKREMAEVQRELDRHRSKQNLQAIIAELEERNEEMERLLKEKCTEIEENDDRVLEMLKENKKLNNKVDTLTRKVQALQTKVATLKASTAAASPKASPIPSVEPAKPSPLSSAPVITAPVPVPVPAFTPVPAPASGRSRPTSVTSSQAPTQPNAPQRTSLASTTFARPLSRTSSSSTTSVRPKTPELTQQAREFSRTAPEQNVVSASPSPVGEVTSVVGKKRRAPDDFEGCESLPPQAFTADSVPKVDVESRTPRVRKPLSSLQSGFTPVRTAARPVAPLPSPRRNNQPTVAPYIDGITTEKAPPSAGSTLASSDNKASKRSWLGKIRSNTANAQGR